MKSKSDHMTIESDGGMIIYLMDLSDGRLVTSSYDNDIRIWDVPKKIYSMVSKGHDVSLY